MAIDISIESPWQKSRWHGKCCGLSAPLPPAMKTKTISLFLGLTALVCLADARAITIAENTAAPGATSLAAFVGQSFTTNPGSPTSNIAFNLFSDVPATTPYALGTGFLLSMEYLGTPAALSSSTPGFLGQATAAGGFYTFDPSLTLLPLTQYFFYENALIPAGAITAGGNPVAGGHLYFTTIASDNFSPASQSLNFRVTGTPVATSVPDNGSTVMLLGIGVVAIAFARRCLSTLGWA
jgi:VPDSG-CTERM motif